MRLKSLFFLLMLPFSVMAYDANKFTYEYTDGDTMDGAFIGFSYGVTDKLSLQVSIHDMFTADESLNTSTTSFGASYLISEEYETDLVAVFSSQSTSFGGTCTPVCPSVNDYSATMFGITARRNLTAGFYLLAGVTSISVDGGDSISSNYLGLDYEYSEVVHFTLTSLFQDNNDEMRIGVDYYY